MSSYTIFNWTSLRYLVDNWGKIQRNSFSTSGFPFRSTPQDCSLWSCNICLLYRFYRDALSMVQAWLTGRLVSSMHTTCMYMLFIFCARILLLYNYSSSCLAFFSLYSSILVSWFANDGLPDGELNKSAVYGDYCKAETITDMLSCFIPILFCNSKHFNKFAMYWSDRSWNCIMKIDR